MTVKWLMHWQPKPGTTLSTQILTEACQCVESIGGQKDGRWRSVLTFYKPMQRDALVPVDHPRDFLGLALQEQPAKYYFILRPNRIVLEADASIQVIMEKLQSYKARVTLNFEATSLLILLHTSLILPQQDPVMRFHRNLLIFIFLTLLGAGEAN